MGYTTIKQVIGKLKAISSKTGLKFVLEGKNVYVTNFGGHRKYAYGTKTELYNQLSVVLDHLYTMELMNND